MSETPESKMPTSVLKDEHRVIERVISVLQLLLQRSKRGEGLEMDSLKRCVEFFRLFADAFHHAKEEDLLFPALEARGIPREGGPIGVMLQEHTLARGFTREMAEGLQAAEQGDASGEGRFQEAARQYIDLLSNHIYKEDNILYTMGDHAMSDDDQKTLCHQFCEVGCRAFGGKNREELERIATELEHQWPAPV